MTPVSRKNLLSLFRAVFLTGLSKLSIMSSPSSSNNEGNDAWLMKIELKREEPMETNKDEGIKKSLPASNWIHNGRTAKLGYSKLGYPFQC